MTFGLVGELRLEEPLSTISLAKGTPHPYLVRNHRPLQKFTGKTITVESGVKSERDVRSCFRHHLVGNPCTGPPSDN